MRKRSVPTRLLTSLLVLLFYTGVATIFVADYLFLRSLPAWAEAIIDAALMTTICSVIMWLLFVRPLKLAYLGETARAKAVLDAAVEGIITIDEGGIVESFNRAAEKMFGYEAKEVIGRNVRMLMPEAYAREHDGYIARYVRTRKARLVGSRELVAQRKDGTQFAVEVSLSEIHVGEMRSFTGFIRDITERKQAEERIRHLAQFDSLTEIPNRMFFYDRLSQAINLARREGRQVALLYLDLDKFKAVNDTRGHDAGDELLKQTASRIRQLLRESDTVARVGGDEFAVILPGVASRQDAAEVVKKMIDVLSTPFDLRDHRREARIGSSIGVAIFPIDAEDAGALVTAADAAMYSAKQFGNTFRFCGA